MIWRVILFWLLGVQLVLGSLPLHPRFTSASLANRLGHVFTTIIFQYDGNGNLTSDGVRTFVYDGENQLTNVSVAGQWKMEFAYDGLRRRRLVREYNWQSGAWTKTNEIRYICDGLLPIQECNSNNVPQVTYTRGLDFSGTIHGAGGIGGLLARTDGSGSTYYHADGAGNITALMDGNGNVVARYEYDPFGKLIGKWGAMADTNIYRFSSKEYHRNSGLYSFGFRFYEPNFQRFINRDPIQELGGINLYQFVGNQPFGAIDPNGLAWTDHIPDWIGNLFPYSGPTYMSPDGTVSDSPPSGDPNYSNLGMLRGELGDNTYNTSDLQTAAAILRAAAEANPIVGGFNSGYTVCTKKDALNHQKVSTADQVQAGGQLAASLGVLIGSLNGLTQAEREFINEMLSQGNDVEIIPRGTGKTADFLINGAETELKTLASSGPNTLKNALETAAQQGNQILIDARNVNISPADAIAQIQRAQGNVGGLQGRVTVLTSQGAVKY